MAGRVVLHVGLPKTGTSFLQRVLWDNAAVLAEEGVRLGSRTRREMFAAALHLTGRNYDWDPVGIDPATTWRRIRDRALSHDGTTVISNEWLATASPELAARALADLSGAEVDLVITVRDLGRQVPAEWQEGIKHGRSVGWSQYLRSVLGDRGRRELRERFWSAQDPLDVAERWGSGLPPERVHLVTCPPAGSDPALLWSRFASVLGVDPDAVTLPGRGVNTSLGRAQVEVLRRVNAVFPRSGQEVRHRALVKKYLVGQVLAPQQGQKTMLPERWRGRVEQITQDWVRRIGESGYHVVGDLDDLRLPVAVVDAPGRDHDAVLRAFAETTRDLLTEIESLRGEVRRAREGPRSSPAGLLGRAKRRIRRHVPFDEDDQT